MKMKKVPDLVFVIYVMREATAVHEANIKKIPVIALVDTNCDPTTVDYIIPSNDDAIRAIKLLVAKIADAVIEGKKLFEERLQAESNKEISAAAASHEEDSDADVPESVETKSGFSDNEDHQTSAEQLSEKNRIEEVE